MRRCDLQAESLRLERRRLELCLLKTTPPNPMPARDH